MAKKERKEVPAPPSLDPARISSVTMTVAALGLHLLLTALVFDPTIFTGGDNGVYVALSRALLERHAYISLHDPTLSPHTLYPPGYPVILALASLVGIRPWVPLKILAVAFSAAGVGFTCLWLRRRTTPGIALFVSVLVAMSPGLLGQGRLELSDVPFWVFAMMALWAFAALPRENSRRVLLAGLATAVAYLTRSAAIPLVVAGLAWLVFERRWRQLAIFAAFVFPAMAAWSWWTSAQGAADLTYGQYANVFWLKDHYLPELGRASIADILLRVFYNGERYGGVMIPLLLTGRRGGPLLLLGLGVLILAMVGWVRRLGRPGIAEFFFPLYGGMLAVLPVAWAGERYLFPIFPIALAYAAETGAWLVRRWQPHADRIFAVTVLAAFLALSAAPVSAAIRVGQFCRGAYAPSQRYTCLGPQWQDYLQMAEWARSGLPEDAVVISRKPGLFFALSDRRGIDIPKTTDPKEFFRLAEEAGARYLILDQVDNLTSQYSVPVMQRYLESFCVVRLGAVQNTAVLGIRFEVPRLPDAAPAEAITIDQCPPSLAAAPAAQ